MRQPIPLQMLEFLHPAGPDRGQKGGQGTGSLDQAVGTRDGHRGGGLLQTPAHSFSDIYSNITGTRSAPCPRLSVCFELIADQSIGQDGVGRDCCWPGSAEHGNLCCHSRHVSNSILQCPRTHPTHLRHLQNIPWPLFLEPTHRVLRMPAPGPRLPVKVLSSL